MNLIFLIIITFIVLSQIVSQDTQCFDPNCITCSSPQFGDCTQCSEDFELINGVCPCAEPNCLYCYSSLYGSCEECKPGFELSFGKCYCSISNCLICGESFCNKCESGYQLSADRTKCEANPQAEIHCDDPNCFSCMNTKPGACTYCKEGYYEDKGVCIKTPDCLNLTYSDFCTECPEGFYAEKEICYPKCKTASCHDSSGQGMAPCDNICYSCMKYLLYEKMDCKPQENYCFDKNCNQCRRQEKGYCERCRLGYYKLEGSCYPCNIDNCLTCEYSEDYTKCSVCMNNFDLQIDGTCKFNSTSLKHYKANTQLPTDPTEPEEKPSEGDGQVPCNVEHCNMCSSTNFCASCESGFQVKNGECIIPCNVENCASCITENVCDNCINDYQLKEDNTCVMTCQEEHCVSCITSKWCIDCEEGYKVSGIGCTPICDDENCAFCSSHTSCISCNNGYVLENNICVPCNDQNCQICSSKEVSMCNNCKYGFLLYEGVCAEKCNLISNCDYCLNNKCVACKNGCNLKEGKCSCFNSFLVISLVVVCIIIIGIGVFCYIGISRKKRQDQLNNMAQGINMVNIVSNRGEIVEPSSEKMKEKYEEEFTDNRVLTEENEYGLCDFCNYKAAKYIADCGCQLCKDHSKPIKDDDDAENIKKCPVCMKVVYKVHPKKFKCGICLEDKIHLAKFKCHCALTVCKDCYIKCKMTNGKCPACRKKIV